MTNRAKRALVIAVWCFMALVPVALIAFDSWSANVTGAESVESGRAVKSLADAGSVLTVDDDGVASTNTRPGTVVLTFDDGPDPEWTPQVLDVLARHNVQATFFVVGRNVVDHPELVRRMRAEGHEVANHTFTHPDLARESDWRRSLELRLTQQALAGATGYVPLAYRVPYSSLANTLDAEDLDVLRGFGGLGELAVFSTTPLNDFDDVTVDQLIARLPEPNPAEGSILLMHDGGGDRSATVAALDSMIPRLQDQGLEVVTMADALGLAPGSLERRATMSERWTGLLLVWTLGTLAAIRPWLTVVVVALLSWAVLKALLDLAFMLLHHRHAKRRLVDPAFSPSVTVVVPAYNEEVGIKDALLALRQSTYPLHQILVVDDGSTDATASIVKSLDWEGLTLVTQRNQGKAVALNTALKHATGSVLVFMDADTVFEPDAIGLLVKRLADPLVGAVSGSVKVGNRGGLLGRFQHLEYIYSLQTDRCAQDLIGATWCIPGAIGVYRRDVLESIGGISPETMAEDIDTAVRVRLAGWKTTFEPRAVAWTEAPATLHQLWKQRRRWHFGNFQALWKHRSSLFRRPWQMGFLMIPYTMLSLVVMPLLLPIVEIVAITRLLTGGFSSVVVLWLALLSLSTLVASMALHLAGEKCRSVWILVIQQFFNRWMYLGISIHVLRRILAGQLLAWNKLERTGEMSPTARLKVVPEPTLQEAGI